MVEKIKRVLKTDYIIILSFYFGILFIFSDFSISAVWGASFLCICSCICFVQCVYNWKDYDRKWEIIDLLLLSFVIIALFNFIRIFEINRTLIYYFLILMSGSIIFWTCKKVSSKSIDISKKILVGVAGIFSIVNIIYFFSSSSVTKIIFPILSETSKEYCIRMYNEGYGFPFGEDIGYTAVVISMGIGIIFINTIKDNWFKNILVLFILFWGLLLIQRRGELLVCIIDLVLVMFIGNVKERKMKKESQPSTIFKTSCIVPQIICILFTFIFFSIVTENNRYNATVESMTKSVNEISPEISDKNNLDKNSIATDDKSKETINIESSDERALVTDLEKADDGNEYFMKKVEELGNGRLILWELAWQAFLENPWFGKGWGSFSKIAPKSGNVRATNVHCVYLQLLCETGIIGFLLIGSFFLIIFILIMKKIWNCKSVKYLKNYLFALYIFLFMLGNGVIDNSIYYSYEIILFIIALMILFRIEEEKNEKNNVNVWN